MNIASPHDVIRIGQLEIRCWIEFGLFEFTIPPNVRVPDSDHQTR